MSHPRLFYKAVVFEVCFVSCVFQNLLRSSQVFKAASMWVFQCGQMTHVHIWGASQISSPLCVAYFYSQLGHFIMVFQKDTHLGTQEIFPPLTGLRLTLLDVQTSVCAKPELLSSLCFPCAKLVIPLYYTVWFSSMNGFTRGSRERIQCTRTLKSDSFD